MAPATSAISGSRTRTSRSAAMAPASHLSAAAGAFESQRRASPIPLSRRKCLGLCPSVRFMRAFSAGREIRPVRAAGHIDPLPNERFPKEEQVSSALILVGAAGMVASVLIASRISSGWILFWLAFTAVLGFGIGVRGKA